MGTRVGETRDMGNTALTVLPPPERCVPHRTPSNGEGGGALEASRDTETGQDRRPPGRRPFRDPRRSRELGRPWPIREAMAVQSAWAAMADPGTPVAMADRGTPAAMAGPPPRPRPQPPPRSLRQEPYYPPKNFLGENRGSIGHLGALGRCGHLRALVRRGHLRALSRSGLWGLLARSRHWRALARSWHGRALARSRLREGTCEEQVREGTCEELAREGTCEEQAREGTCEEQVREGTCEEGALEARTLGGALEALTLGGALEALTLGGALEALTLPHSLTADLPHSLTAGLPGPQTAVGLGDGGQISALTGQMWKTGPVLSPPGQRCWRPTYGLEGTQGNVGDCSPCSGTWGWPLTGLRLGIGDCPVTGWPSPASLGWRCLDAPLADGKRSRAGTESWGLHLQGCWRGRVVWLITQGWGLIN